ncbi:MAG: hypothetical protein H6524_04910 [Actinobacteria bacterium]|nr:hypothetical protein [Micrococcales bacterium]MCB0903729.1 hypothetical protein [Actinomycetota bacterium]MCO5299540.1 hypothetical protein [Candidatus Nanopelagicales bacterium]MCB9428132.1 hypothetical protein [Actinomycetota bacterium]HPE13268.1 hypothetical protein [Actinomycetota bacterium]
MRKAIMGTSLLLLVLGMSPARTDDVSASDAVAQINAACSASRDVLVGVGGTIDGPVDLVSSPGRLASGSQGKDLVLDSATGTYGALSNSGLSARKRATALKYLKRSDATHWLNRGVFADPQSGWTASFEQARDASLDIGSDCAGGLADQSVTRSANTWRFATAVVTVDEAGRLLAWEAQGVERRFSYAVGSIDLPERTVTFAQWSRASQAATLNATLRTLSRQIATTVNQSPATAEAIAEQAAAAVADPRAVPLKVRQLRKGTLLFARNPYTKRYHAWRVYVRDEQAVARPVAP